MSDELSKPFTESSLSKEEMMKMNRERRVQIITFAFMIFLTILAFVAVGMEMIEPSFTIPFILLLAVVQFVLQLFYFMHLKDKDHEWPNAFMLTGIVVATPAVIALVLLLGVTKY
ncbi:cytochrome-c oxidase [Salibacterium salarium]|uniref:Cytochrome-c oxidase n=1 Tax=Salibacterium salarium TaxID=284579 RepID=A0A428MW39_9BACI|nr:cytochrome C oxidase subunit IV family protein [Salibacterium salarium]RSL30403.1 cytochrome-c oxidase [Salibacterium salarium]